MVSRLGPLGTSRGDGSRAVGIGGGHGLARSLRALTHVVDHVTAVVTAADDGGSSGRIRRELGIIPPGDLRMAISALSPDDGMRRLLQYRFSAGEGLLGHSLGNLMTVALHDIHGGDMVAALDELARLLQISGRVLPCTTELVSLSAQTRSGQVDGQVAVARSVGIERAWLTPAGAVATPEAVAAIEGADLVVLGPGSLYTSILPNLLVKGVAEAVVQSTGPVVYVANMREQLGETERMSIADHVTALRDHVDGLRLDAVIVHEGDVPAGAGRPLVASLEDVALRELVDQVIARDLLDGHDGHEPVRLAAAIAEVLGRHLST